MKSGPLNLVGERNTSCRITFVCDADEVEFLDEIAGDYKVSRSVILHTLIRDALGPHYEQRHLAKLKKKYPAKARGRAEKQKPQPKSGARARRS